MGNRTARPEVRNKPEAVKLYPAWSDLRKEVGHHHARSIPSSPSKGRDWCDLFADERESKAGEPS